MKICLVTAYFPPEQGSAATLFHDLGAELVGRGHTVTVLTGFPTYNVDPSGLRDDYRTASKLRESIKGMEVLRSRSSGMPRNVPVLRGIGQLAMAWTFLRSGRAIPRGWADVMLVYSPPLFLGLTALMLRRSNGHRVIFNVQDLFPQSAIDLHVLKNRVLIGVFRWVERLIYRSVDMVAVHSDGNKRHVESCGVHPDAVTIVPNLVDTKRLQPGERNGPFRKKHGIPAKTFLVSFAGVIGLSQDLDTVLDTAQRTTQNEDILYYIVGDGLEKERLERRASSLPNVRFLPMLPQLEYLELLQASDVCLATLRKDVRTPVVPSKILSIMAAGRPVLAAMPLEGDAPALIKRTKAGRCVRPEDAMELTEAVMTMYADAEGRAMMGRNGREYVERETSLERIADLYEDLFQKVVSQSTNGTGT